MTTMTALVLSVYFAIGLGVAEAMDESDHYLKKEGILGFMVNLFGWPYILSRHLAFLLFLFDKEPDND